MEVFRRGCQQRVEVGKVIGQGARRVHPDMQNPEPKKEAPERLPLAALDRGFYSGAGGLIPECRDFPSH